MTREENLEVLSRLQPLHLTDCRKISVITLLQDLGPKSKGNHPFYEIQNKSFRHPKNWFWFINLWLLVISHILFIECFIVLKMVQAFYFQQYLFLVSDYHLMMLPAERGYFVFLIIYLTTLWKFGIFENILDIHLRPYLLLLIVLKM